MTESRDNPLALLSKRSCQDRTDYGRELQKLHADLEAERKRTLWAYERLCVELRSLREEAEREHQRAVTELAARRGCQKERTRHRFLLDKGVKIKDTGQHEKVHPTGEKAFSFCSEQTQLLKLYEKITGEKASHELHRNQDFELEKAIFLCHLLEAYGRLLQGPWRVRSTSYVAKTSSRKRAQKTSTDVCQKTSPQAHSRPPLHNFQSDFQSSKKKPRQDLWRRPVGRHFPAVATCTTTAVEDTCQSSSLQTCHPHNIPHARLENHPSCWAESSGSGESSASKCMEGIMEVSSFLFLHESYH